ncbi:OmpA family protein [Paragemmobacter kunshanensis]|nr:OmpA family protein [Rhodobacter kunshanensis]
MTISFLLIVMILLAFFATQLSSQDTVPRDQFNVILNDLREARADIRRLEAERDAAREALDAAISERNAAIEERDRLRAENADLLARIRELEALVDQLQRDLDAVTAERDDLLERLSRLQQINPLEAYLAQAIEQRREILIELRERLLIEFPDLQVVISAEQDALRFQGEGLFRSGSSQLEPRQRQIVDTMGRLLDEILVCFTLGDRANRGPDCDSGNALIEAVQIEGHTDADGSDLNNLRLSTDRANATLLVMLDEERTILAHENLRGQPVMSVSGYGEMRPIETNATTEGKAANRRIDLRIIMYAPSTVEEVEEIGRRLDALRAAGGSE